MTEPIHDKIKRFLQAAEGLYHRLVLLVGKTGSGKTGILRDIAEEFGSSVVNVNLALSSQEFQIGLSQRFIERDGMFFLPDQVAEYDRKKMTAGGLNETIEMFVKDEASMIHWLRNLIKQKPQTFSDINPQFMQQLGGWSKNEAQLDLRELLNQNFLCYDGKGPVREKVLLKEFEEYKAAKKKLKVFRLESVRAGFKKAWQERDYAVIVAVADKIPNNVLEEDPKLLMWYDQAVTRMGGE